MVAVAASSAPLWQPTKIRRVARALPTGTQAVEVVTDAGPAYAKFLGNTEGPHVLAAEFIGTKLAALLGLPVLDHAVFDYDGVPEVVLTSGGKAQPGPAWITRREERVDWSGEREDLDLLANPDDVAGLVVLDTWTRNCDRYCPSRQPPRVNRNNVFFSREGAPEGSFRLVAMDHTHILTCGRELTPALARIDVVKDETVYGLFPEFAAFIQPADLRAACSRLAAVGDAAIRAVVTAVPAAWQVDTSTRTALFNLLTSRRDYVAGDLPTRVFPQTELF
jgi:hypothetical protein